MTCFVMQADVNVHGSTTVTTPTFHTAAAGEVLLAFVSADGPTGSGQQHTTVSGAGLTWTLVKRANTQPGDAEVWQATAPTVLSSATITSTASAKGFGQSLTVIAMEGVSGIGASVAGSAGSGAPKVSLTTASPTSLVFAVGHDWDNAIARTLPSARVLLDQWLSTFPTPDPSACPATPLVSKCCCSRNGRDDAGCKDRAADLDAIAATQHPWLSMRSPCRFPMWFAAPKLRPPGSTGRSVPTAAPLTTRTTNAPIGVLYADRKAGVEDTVKLFTGLPAAPHIGRSCVGGEADAECEGDGDEEGEGGE